MIEPNGSNDNTSESYLGYGGSAVTRLIFPKISDPKYSELEYINVSENTIKFRSKFKKKKHNITDTILDSGATTHIFTDRKHFQNINKQYQYDGIRVGNGHTVSTEGWGT